MDAIFSEYMQHYHTVRPHQGEGIANELLNRKKKRGRPRKIASLGEVVPLNEIRCSERPGGLLKSYWRKAG